MISDNDYKDYKAKRTTPYHLAVKYGVSITTMYKYIRACKGTVPWTRYTKEDREALRADLLAAVPHSKDLGTQAVLERWGIRSLGNALSLLKVKSMAELRYGSVELVHTLRALKLVLAGDILYARGNRQKSIIKLTPEELQELIQEPVQWIRDNITRIRALY